MAPGLLVAEIAGGVAAGAGRVKANRDEARALNRNADRLAEAAEISELNKLKRQRLFRQDLDEFEAQQVGSFAKAGVELSGSALNKLHRTAARASEELSNLTRQSDFESRASREQANQLLRQSNRLESTETQGMAFGSSVLGGTTSGLSNFQRFK